MSDIGALVDRLMDAGVSAGDAAEIVAMAFAAGAASAAYRKSPGAIRQERWRARNKASQSVTRETPNSDPLDASQSVSNRNEASQRDTAPLYIDKKERKREAAASQIAPDWKPDEPTWIWTIEQLKTEDRANRELDKFKNDATAKGKKFKIWSAAWRNWVTRAVEWSPPLARPPDNRRSF